MDFTNFQISDIPGSLHIHILSFPVLKHNIDYAELARNVSNLHPLFILVEIEMI